MQQSIALVTKTYRGDLVSFRQLCASIDQHMPDTRHIVAVDRGDLHIFHEFASSTREIVNCSAILPNLHEFSVFGRRLWWHRSGRLVRGWIYQQLAKIAVVASLPEKAAVIVDSDARFIAPLSSARIFDGQAVRMFRNPGAPSGPVEESSKWHDVAANALGLAQRGYTGADYIAGATIWSPEVVRAMIERIRSVHGNDWLTPLVRPLRISEYVIYGVFCDHVDGPHQKQVFATDKELAHCSWFYDLDKPDELDRFVDALEPDMVAALVQSIQRLPDDQREILFARLKVQHGRLSANAP